MPIFIEVRVKTFLGRTRFVSIPIDKIWQIREEADGAIIKYSRTSTCGSLYKVHCIESYYEVMSLISEILNKLKE